MGDKRVHFKEKLSYGLGAGGGNIITTFIGTFMTAYYTDTVGIAVAAIGTMMLLTRIFDGITDILMGALIDRTKTKWGKARPWLFVGAPLVGIGFALCCNVPQFSNDTLKLIYIYFTYIFSNCIAGTIYMVSHNALLARITFNVEDRQSMASICQIVNNVVRLLISGYTLIAIERYGWRNVSIFLGIIVIAMIWICAFCVKEHIDLENETNYVKVHNEPLSKAVPALFKNKYFYLLALLFILILSIVTSTGSMGVYYCKYILEDMGMMVYIAYAGTVPGIIANFFIPKLVSKLKFRKTLILSSVITLIGFLIPALMPYSKTAVIIGLIIRSCGTGAFFSCGFALSAQVVDYGEWKFHIRSEGLINSAVSFGQKIGLGLGAAAGSWILALGGYVGAAQVQSESAKTAIIFAYTWIGVILAGLLLLVSFMFTLDKHQDHIREELEMRHKN